MTKSLLLRVWDKTLKSLDQHEEYEKERVGEIQEAVMGSLPIKFEEILKKKYEDKEA